MSRQRFAALLLLLAATAAAGSAAAQQREVRPVSLMLPKDGAGNIRYLSTNRSWAADSPQKAVARTETTLLVESFEESWPAAPWSVSHGENAPDVYWGRTNLRASEGSHSIWCAYSGSESPGTGGLVPLNTMSWVVAGPYDLSEAVTGRLSFDLWLRSDEFHDYFMWLASTDGESFRGASTSTNTDGWESRSVDLTSFGTQGDVTGLPAVWIAFVYQSDHVNRFEGAYVDNVTLVADAGSEVDVGYTYTSDDDFEAGDFSGLEIDDDSLKLSTEWSTLPYLWVPNPDTGTVSKIDTESGDELARYRTGPDRSLEPSPAAVDLSGNCWVGNRKAGTVVKIGLKELGACVDRNNNGEIDTSADDNEDGDITGDELLDWGEDECVLYEVLLTGDRQETYVPGNAHTGYANNQLQALAVDAEGAVWVGVGGSGVFYRLDSDSGEVLKTLDVSANDTRPYAALIDGNGTLWSASWPDAWALKIDPETEEQTVIDLAHGSRALAADDAEHLYVSGYDFGVMSRIDTSTDLLDMNLVVDWQANGIAVTENQRIWVATGYNVKRYNQAGYLEDTIECGYHPTGLAVDAAGKIWVVSSGSNRLLRIDPAFNQFDLEKELVDSGKHETTSDMTGIVARTITTRIGEWTVTYDSQVAGTAWGTITWNATEPEGTSIVVRVRSSGDELSWSSWEQATSGVYLQATPAGRYLEIEMTMQRLSGSGVPVLKDLTVTPMVAQLPDAEFSWSPTEPVTGETVVFTDTSTGDPTSWAWDFGDGGTSTLQHPTHIFGTAGVHVVLLTVENAEGSNTGNASLTVLQGCALSCSAAVPATATVDEAVSFTATATPTSCTGELSYAWAFGDGATGTEQSPSHTYTENGDLQWSMTATISGVSCSDSGSISISGGSPEECTAHLWVPVVSHAGGEAGSVWRSDLALLGVSTGTTSVQLRFHGPDGVVSQVTSITQGAMVDVVDVVDWISPGSEGSGALEVCADKPLIVTSRTYNQLAGDAPCLADGSFGQRLDGMESSGGLAAGEIGYLPQLRENAAFRTNLGVTNSGSTPAVLSIGLYDASGSLLKSYQAEFAPGEWWQDSRPFQRRAGRDDVSGWARIVVKSGSGVLAYASVIDNISNDATTVTVRR